MFRAVCLRRAPLASLKPVLADCVTSHSSVSRFLGVRSGRAPNASAINAVVERTKGDGLVGAAASVARASLYLVGHNPTATIEEINAVLPKIQDEPLKRLAVGIRLRALNDLLDSKEAALSVSGGATEAEVSEIRSKLQVDYNSLKSSSPNCWLVKLACTEYKLYTGNAEEAYEQFIEIERTIQSYIDQPITVSDAVATKENTNTFSLLGFLLHRAHSTRLVKPGQRTNPVVSEGISAVADDPAARNALVEFKKQVGEQLSDEEALEIAFTLEQANIRHHFHDFFPAVSEYEDWSSVGAEKVKALLNASQESSKVVDESIDKVRNAVPPKAFYGAEDKLKELLKNAPKDKSLIQSIRSTFGAGPQTPLSNADNAYFEVVEALKSAGVTADSAGTTTYAQYQRETSKVLAQQLLYRTQVQIGVALTEMERFHEAVEVLTPIITADEYVYMWRALLARSRAYKGLGLITKSDRDAKVLKNLQRSLSEHAPYEMI